MSPQLGKPGASLSLLGSQPAFLFFVLSLSEDPQELGPSPLVSGIRELCSIEAKVSGGSLKFQALAWPSSVIFKRECQDPRAPCSGFVFYSMEGYPVTEEQGSLEQPREGC